MIGVLVLGIGSAAYLIAMRSVRKSKYRNGFALLALTSVASITSAVLLKDWVLLGIEAICGLILLAWVLFFFSGSYQKEATESKYVALLVVVLLYTNILPITNMYGLIRHVLF